MANELYFNRVRKKILDTLAIKDITRNQALLLLRKNGGVNPLGWILPLVFLLISLIPLGIIEEEKLAEKQRIFQEQQAAAKAAQEAAKRKAAEQLNFDKAVAEIEARIPQLNSKSPQYNQQAVDWVINRKQEYEKLGGRTDAESLRAAAADYLNAIQQQNTHQNTQSQQSTQQGHAAYFGGEGRRASFNFQNIAISALLQVFADASGRRFVADDSIAHTGVNIYAIDMPWNDAFMQMLERNGLTVIKVNSGYYVFPIGMSDDVAYRKALQKGL